MKKLVTLLLVVLVGLLWILGCDKTRSTTTKPEATNNSSQEENSSQTGDGYKSMHAYVVVPEGGSKVVSVFDSLTKKTVVPGIIGERVSVLTGDADNIYRIVDITTKEKSHFDVLIKGKKNHNIEVTVDVQGDNTEPEQDKPVVWTDDKGDGFIKIFLDPANKKWNYEYSMEGN